MSTREPGGRERTPQGDRRITTRSPDELLRILMALECAGSGAEGMIVRGRQTGRVEEQPFLLVKRPDAYVIWPARALAMGPVLAAVAGPVATDRLTAWLAAIGGGRDAAAYGLFSVCYFAALPARQEFAAVVEREGQFVLAVRGEIIARARSLRSNAEGAEVWVETAADYRRRGYGRRVAAAWGYEQLAQGRAAFYCYAVDNRASARLAQSLGLLVLADGLWC